MKNQLRTQNKALYRVSKMLNGKLHPLTLWYLLLYSPLGFLYSLISLPFKLITKLLSSKAIMLCLYNCKIRAIKKANPHQKVKEIIKPIALYLPQYHEVKENSEWWGEGFTEWTNVRRAAPLFEGHYQPHVPHQDIGYYDLADITVMKKQAEMAKAYGVYGFCFYYYHFKDGRRLLEKPINNWLKSKDIDFPFCFAWANENWTRTWDGGEKDIIMPQDYDEHNMLQMIKEMLEAFKDERYIKFEGKPVLLVYRAEIIPEIKKLVSEWRDLVKEAGFEDVYLISMQNFAKKNPVSMGFDAAVEFAPQTKNHLLSMHWFDIKKLCSSCNYINYQNVIKTMNEPQKLAYTRYKSVCPSWDNTARRGKKNSRVLLFATPRLFFTFLKNAVKQTLASSAKGAGFLFINAWNEWGEGAHLEPDEKYGYQNLEVLKELMNMNVKEL